MLTQTETDFAALKRGGWFRANAEGILVFRSSPLITIFCCIMALIFAGGAALPWLNLPPSSQYFAAVLMSAIFCGTALLMLYLGGPRELRINLKEKTYHYRFRWVPFLGAKISMGSLIHFSGVCITRRDILMLVFRRRRGLVYGLTLGSFWNRAEAMAAAEEFTAASGLPVVRVPWANR